MSCSNRWSGCNSVRLFLYVLLLGISIRDCEAHESTSRSKTARALISFQPTDELDALTNNNPVQCRSNVDCKSTSAVCEPTTGFCCLITSPAMSNVNSIGCPMGFRHLKASTSRLLVCQPEQKSSCPGDAICFENPTQKTWNCCAKDPTEGCAPGMRSVKLADGSARLCRPEAANSADVCPHGSTCQWSFLIDQYQCCEADNGNSAGRWIGRISLSGCTRGEEPVRRSGGGIRSCVKKEDCPLHAHCSFNFWTASMQCCRRDPTQLCPASQIAYLNPLTSIPIECVHASECPTGYKCSNGFCCGNVGNCPRPGYHPTRDENGRLRSCLPSMPDCPEGSSCETSITDRQQGLCCSKNVLTCRNFGTPFPNSMNPQICNLNAHPSSCPIDADCQESNIPGTSICCKRDGSVTNFCPDNWTLLNGKTTYCSPNDYRSCSGQSSCLLSPLTQQFVCCMPVLKTVAFRQSALQRQVLPFSEFNCPPQYAGPEVVNNRERRCNGFGDFNQCSIGFACVQSIESNQVFICCGPTESNDSPLFRCPNAGDTPAISAQGGNIFCDTARGLQTCPRGSTCQSAVNSFGMMICCQSNPSVSPVCPEGRSAQPAAVGYVPCDTNQPNQCNQGFVCLASVNQPDTSLCCSRLNNQPLICPNQQVLYKENGRPKICSLLQINPCPSGYLCRASVGAPSIGICCSLPTTAICPSGYTAHLDFNGNPIFCSELNPNVCPGGSQCLESENQAQLRLCCRSSNVARVCPDGLDALLQPDNSRPERCTEPGAACSQPGYQCYLSDILAGYVCCGRSQQLARCADGRETYVQDFGRTFTCQLTQLNGCPLNYDCAPSNLNGVNVCCRTGMIVPTTSPPLPTPSPYQPDLPTFRPPVSELTCPVGWSAYEDNTGAHHFCQNALDNTCPQGFSCVQSSVNGIFLCCRLASNLRCNNARATALLVNNAPRLCSQRFVASCPQGYQCQQSNISPVNICCSIAITGPTINGQTNPFTSLNGGDLLTSQLLCRDGQTPAFVSGKTVLCNYIGQQDACPPTYICTLSNRQGVNVCCHIIQRSRSRLHLYSKRAHNNVCGDSTAALTYDGEPIECSKDPQDACPKNFECQPSMIDEYMYCCQDAQCAVDARRSSSEVESTILPKRCVKDSDCSKEEKCEESFNIQDVKVCCPQFTLETLPSLLANEEKPRCIGRQTFLLMGNAISCTDSGGCPPDYDCSSLTTTGDSICCEQYNPTNNVCPENRDPFRHVSTDEPAFCDPNDSTDSCPDGFICRNSPLLRRHVCCSPIAFCDPNTGRVPFIDERTKQAKRCFELTSTGTNSEECGHGFTCSSSTVPKIRVCCSAPETHEFVLGAAKEADRDESDKQLWTILEG
ncbi:hypothetical protein M3Y98_00860600 [Aphelenchoides besseyi]|nr:hypothetical protein M3Y98_00860600 [Aphelenchoides besseyi]